MRFTRLCIYACFMLLGLIGSAFASSHSAVYTKIANETGIVIAPLEHGQMVVLDDHRNAILSLALKHRDDPIIAELVRYGNIEYRYALFGFWPKTLADAETPFHVPTHAYLASARATLIRLTEIAGSDAQVANLAAEVDRQMILQQGTSLSLCQYSTLEFNTAKTVGPVFTAVAQAQAALFAFLLFTVIAMAATTFIVLGRRGITAQPIATQAQAA